MVQFLEKVVVRICDLLMQLPSLLENMLRQASQRLLALM